MAIVNFYTDTIRHDPTFGSAGRVAAMHLLEPVTRAAVQRILADALAAGQELMVYETYRSQARQLELYNRGASKLAKVGVHHYGLACDLVKRIGGEPSWKGSFAFLGSLAAKHGLVWGGAWKGFPDAVHVQRVKVADQPRLFRGEWYPEAGYRAVTP